MILVAGLGNIGKDYENTRHNAGFMLLDLFENFLSGQKEDFSFLPSKLSSILELFPFSNFNAKTRIKKPDFKGEVVKFNSLLLLKPHTFMNASGLSVKAVKDFYKCQRLIVLHDDLDLNLGALKFKKGGSAGGHNGLKSIDKCCGNDYERIRIGIGKAFKQENISDFVLSTFQSQELKLLQISLKIALLALLELIYYNDIHKIASRFSVKNITSNSSFNPLEQS